MAKDRNKLIDNFVELNVYCYYYFSSFLPSCALVNEHRSPNRITFRNMDETRDMLFTMRLFDNTAVDAFHSITENLKLMILSKLRV